MDSKTIELVSGYDRSKKPTMQSFHIVTLAEVIGWSVPLDTPCTFCGATGQLVDKTNWHGGIENLYTGPCFACNATGIQYRDITPGHVWFVSVKQEARIAKVNGKVRTWKRDANRVELPIKYGMYEYATFTQDDINNGRLIMPVGE